MTTASRPRNPNALLKRDRSTGVVLRQKDQLGEAVLVVFKAFSSGSNGYFAGSKGVRTGPFKIGGVVHLIRPAATFSPSVAEKGIIAAAGNRSGPSRFPGGSVARNGWDWRSPQIWDGKTIEWTVFLVASVKNPQRLPSDIDNKQFLLPRSLTIPVNSLGDP